MTPESFSIDWCVDVPVSVLWDWAFTICHSFKCAFSLFMYSFFTEAKTIHIPVWWHKPIRSLRKSASHTFVVANTESEKKKLDSEASTNAIGNKNCHINTKHMSNLGRNVTTVRASIVFHTQTAFSVFFFCSLLVPYLFLVRTTATTLHTTTEEKKTAMTIFESIL